jgi:hypothetical protein
VGKAKERKKRRIRGDQRGKRIKRPNGSGGEVGRLAGACASKHKIHRKQMTFRHGDRQAAWEKYNVGRRPGRNNIYKREKLWVMGRRRKEEERQRGARAGKGRREDHQSV